MERIGGGSVSRAQLRSPSCGAAFLLAEAMVQRFAKPPETNHCVDGQFTLASAVPLHDSKTIANGSGTVVHQNGRSPERPILKIKVLPMPAMVPYLASPKRVTAPAQRRDLAFFRKNAVLNNGAWAIHHFGSLLL